MSKRKIVVEYKGVEYEGELMTIASTWLGYEEHGVFSFMLNCESSGGGIGVGGYVLDTPSEYSSGERVATGYGLDVITQVLKTAGVRKWEDLKGLSIIVLYDPKFGSGWGGKSVGFANLLDENRVFIMDDHLNEYRKSTGA